MNILVTHKAVDVATYKMLGELSHNEFFKIYQTIPFAADAAKVEGKCIPLIIPPITSKISWKSIKALRLYVKKYNIDLIFSPSTSGLSNALIATIGTSVKNVGYRGTQAKVKKLDPTYYMGLLNPRVSHIVCETEDIQEYLSHYIDKKKLSVSVKPFDTDWVADACLHPKQVDGVPEDAFKCIYIGTTKGRPFKGLTYLIKAFQILNAPNAHLVVIGDYDNSDYELAQKGAGAERIHFLWNREDAIYFLPKQDLFILPALRDASPRVVREAMACGVPCIVTDIPGARDLIVDNESGLLVPSASPDKIADAMRLLMNDRVKLQKMAKASRERIINEFSVEAYVAYFDKLFASLS
ncbi:glycosyltransferase [Bacteroides faecium]|uniref:Glycosyltransferase family 4 protein n=1 Tax=Bacteroides faecium TaxID=2715212 RepID=A0A6H0KN13_9BACE|nr:glycosyltransferase [Bacteroides faecium]QIU93767.1 glycosyltransferase family 4 protein [Bacteroides faecium]